jgi:hypothetical protein
MQTPAGYKLVESKFMVTDFVAAIFNPSIPTRLGHMLVACFEASMFAIAGISAYFLLKGRDEEFFRRSLGIALVMAAVCPYQIYLGDTVVAMFSAISQPNWPPWKPLETNTQGAPFAVVALPSMAEERNLYQITVTHGLSLLLTHSLQGRVPGLKEFPRQDRPNVPVLFWTFRLMVAIGFLFLLVMLWAGFLWRRGKVYAHRPFLGTLVAIQPLGFLATEVGWITTEMGRQPWLVYNLMRTSEGISPIPAGNVVWSLSLIGITFLLIGEVTFTRFQDAAQRSRPGESPSAHSTAGGMRALERTKGRQGQAMNLVSSGAVWLESSLIALYHSRRVSLGVGLLFPRARNENERNVMMKASPGLGCDQTWLVLAGSDLCRLSGATACSRQLIHSPFHFHLRPHLRGVAFEFGPRPHARSHGTKPFPRQSRGSLSRRA